MANTVFELVTQLQEQTSPTNLLGVLPRYQAHRGFWVALNQSHQEGAGGVLENTLESLKRAKKFGFGGAEFDVRLSRDGVPVLLHDANLLRSHGLEHSAAQLSFAELVEAGVVSLEAVLSDPDVPDFLNIEIKSETLKEFQIEWAVAKVLRKYKGPKKLLISSFNPKTLILCRMLVPQIERAFLINFTRVNEFQKNIFRNYALLAGMHPSYLHLNCEDIQPAEVKLLSQQGYRINLWTVNDLQMAEEYLAAGACSIITDSLYPELVLAGG